MKIGVDIDEVLAEFIRGYLNFYKCLGGRNILFEEVFDYDFWKVIGVDRSETFHLADLYYGSKYFEDISLVDGAERGIRELSKNNELFLVTARPIKIKEKTELFIQKYFSDAVLGIFYSGDVFNSQGNFKSNICKMNEISLIIEDNFNCALDCARAGIDVLLFDKPWNRNHEVNGPIKRVKDWNEILENIKCR